MKVLTSAWLTMVIPVFRVVQDFTSSFKFWFGKKSIKKRSCLPKGITILYSAVYIDTAPGWSAWWVVLEEKARKTRNLRQSLVSTTLVIQGGKASWVFWLSASASRVEGRTTIN